MHFLAFVTLIFFSASPSSAIFYEYVPECARDGVHYGAGLGALAGGMTGAAALTGTGKWLKN